MDPRYLIDATEQEGVEDALAYVAEGNPLRPDADLRRLLRIVATLPANQRGRPWRGALQRLARQVSISEFDSSAVLFQASSIDSVSDYQRALDALASSSPTRTLVGMTAASVAAAQRAEPRVAEVLCAIAGISTRDLAERLPDFVPADTRQPWTQQGIERAFGEIDTLVSGQRTTVVAGAVPARALEFAKGFVPDGWASVERLRTQGVPYALLLLQREVGTAWGAHRNRTQREPAQTVAAQLCAELDRHRVVYRRASSAGGEITPSAIEGLVGRPEPGLVILRVRTPVLAVIFSVARDGGTARKNAGRVKGFLEGAKVPMVVVLLGPGWSGRNETVELAEAYQGRIYTDRDIPALVNDIRQEVGR